MFGGWEFHCSQAGAAGRRKIVHAWAVEGDCEAESIRSNSFTVEWPPRSGQRKEFLGVDRAGWFSLELAREKILKGQFMLLDELQRILKDVSDCWEVLPFDSDFHSMNLRCTVRTIRPEAFL